jgi:N-acetylneuraminic acid mutarotase
MTRTQETVRTVFVIVAVLALGALANVTPAAAAPFTTVIGVVLVATVYVGVGIAPHR